jgi:hypothetical protein
MRRGKTSGRGGEDDRVEYGLRVMGGRVRARQLRQLLPRTFHVEHGWRSSFWLAAWHSSRCAMASTKVRVTRRASPWLSDCFATCLRAAALAAGDRSSIWQQRSGTRGCHVSELGFTLSILDPPQFQTVDGIALSRRAAHSLPAGYLVVIGRCRHTAASSSSSIRGRDENGAWSSEAQRTAASSRCLVKQPTI